MEVHRRLFSSSLSSPSRCSRSLPADAAAAEQELNFAKELPANLDFSNSTGGQLQCTGVGIPAPTTTWLMADGSPVSSVPGLRQVTNDGNLVFPPFSAQDYRQDIHGVSYTCAVSNPSGTLVSNEIKVRGVVLQAFDVHVYDVYAIRGNIAVMRCHIPKFLERYVTVTAWILDSVISITSSNLDSNSKYWMLSSGELFINDVDSSDTHKSYRCQATHRLSGEIKASVTSGRLIVTESQGKVPPKIVYSKSKVEVAEGQEFIIPCIANGNPVPKYTWFKQSSLGQLTTVRAGGRKKLAPGFLSIEDAQESDGGTYSCTVTNEVNSEKIITQVIIQVPLRVTISPNKMTVDHNHAATFTCKIIGSPISSITWLKDGKMLPKENIVQNSNETVHITKVLPNMSGIYQCFASNEYSTAYGYAVLKLGDVIPIITNQFDQRTFQPGDKVVLECSAKGNPRPNISWTLDNMDLPSRGDFQISYKLLSNDEVSSTLRILSVRVEDGGLYRCVAKNKAGQTIQATRINVEGKLAVRTNVEFKAVEGGFFQLDCPVFGFPFYNIRWEKDGEDALHARRAIHPNGSMTIINVDRNIDSGAYMCFVEDDNGRQVQGEVRVSVLVPPKITPFYFQDDLIREGARARITCVVSDGESPLKITWFKNDHTLNTGDGVSVRHLDEFSSILMISSISPRHNGNYTCLATNAAGVARHTAPLFVNVPPKIMPFTFQDDQFFMGMRAQIICAVSQGDMPIHFEWLKDYRPIDSTAGINIRNYDGYSNSLSIESVSSSHTGNYTCVASNKAAKTSHTAQLLVQVSPKITPFAFRNNQLAEGSLARISCVVYQGDLPITLQWLKDDLPVTEIGDVTTRTLDDYSSILTIENVERKHSGNYTCSASNAAATARHTTQLIVHVPPKVVPFIFQDDHLLEGTLVRVSCVVSRGDLPLTINWLKDGQEIPTELSLSIREFDEYSSVLSIDPVTAAHSGNYTCIAHNHAGSAKHTANLNVQVPPRWILAPKDTVVRNGNQVTLNCQADGFPKPTITWKKALSIDLIQHSKLIRDDDHLTVYSNGTLSINNVQQIHGGLYICFASNNIRSPLSKVVNVKIQAAPEFAEQESKLIAKKGDDIQILCEASGDWPISYVWSVGDQEIDGTSVSQRYKIENSQDKVNLRSFSTLIVTWVDRKDSTVFKCNAKNNIGESEKDFSVTVQENPDAPIFKSTKINNQTIILEWTQEYNGNSEITHYVLQYKKEVDRWNEKTEALRLPGTKSYVSITDLKPATLYNFRVMAENGVGNGSFSDILKVKTEETVPEGPPENVEVESMDANTLRVTWKPPKKSLWNGAIRGYNIGYKVYGTSEQYVFTSLEVPEDYTEDLIYQILDLNMYTQYIVIVEAFNSKGKGPNSEPVLAMTSEDVPSSPPEDVRCSSLSSKSIYVLWEPPAPDSINGILRGYKILYKLVDEWYDAAIQSRVSQVPKVTLQNLEVNTNYSIQVLAFTKMGDGAKCAPIFCKTHEDVPEPPEAIKVLPSSSDSVIVAWKPPHKANGAVIKYKVYYKGIEDRQQFDLDTQDTEEFRRDATVHESHPEMEFMEVKGLKKNKKYAFWVTATSAIGESSGSSMTAQTVADSIVAAKTASFDKQIKTPWKEDIVLPCKAVGVPMPNRKWTVGNKQLIEHSRIKVRNDGAVVINKAIKVDSGNYSCAVYNEYGRDEVNYLVVIQVPPSAPILDIVSKSRNSIKIQWKPGMNGGDNIRGYLLHYKQETGTWTTKEIRPEQTLYNLDNLSCGATYQLYMEAFSNIGTGPPCDTITVSTEGADVVPPAKENIIREGSTFITVHLDAWPSSGCPVKSFAAEYKGINNKDWITVSNKIGPMQKKLVVSGLTPATWYILRLTVESTGGQIVTEYKFATYTTTGGTVAPNVIEESVAPVYIFYLDPLIFIPAVALLIVVIIASVVVCLYFKRRTGSVGSPSDSPYLETEMDMWLKTSHRTLPRNKFHHPGMSSTLTSRSSKEPSPYATSHVTPDGRIHIGLPSRAHSIPPQFPAFTNDTFQRAAPGCYPQAMNMNETTFLFPMDQMAQQLKMSDDLKGNPEPEYDPPPMAHMIRNAAFAPNCQNEFQG